MHVTGPSGAYRYRKSTKEYIFCKTCTPRRTNAISLPTNDPSLLNKKSVSSQIGSEHDFVTGHVFEYRY